MLPEILFQVLQHHFEGFEDIDVQGADLAVRIHLDQDDALAFGAILLQLGAGDGFAAGLISSLLDKADIIEAIRTANGVGAMQLLNPGDNEGLPTREQLEEFMAGHGK